MKHGGAWVDVSISGIPKSFRPFLLGDHNRKVKFCWMQI